MDLTLSLGSGLHLYRTFTTRNFEDLSVEESKQLAKLIGQNKHAFAMSQTDLGQTSVVKHSISTGVQDLPNPLNNNKGGPQKPLKKKRRKY